MANKTKNKEMPVGQNNAPTSSQPNVVSFSIEERARVKIDEKFDDLINYAKENGFKKPKKSDFMTRIILKSVDSVGNPERYFRD